MHGDGLDGRDWEISMLLHLSRHYRKNKENKPCAPNNNFVKMEVERNEAGWRTWNLA